MWLGWNLIKVRNDVKNVPLNSNYYKSLHTNKWWNVTHSLKLKRQKRVQMFISVLFLFFASNVQIGEEESHKILSKNNSEKIRV